MLFGFGGGFGQRKSVAKAESRKLKFQQLAEEWFQTALDEERNNHSHAAAEAMEMAEYYAELAKKEPV